MKYINSIILFCVVLIFVVEGYFLKHTINNTPVDIPRSVVSDVSTTIHGVVDVVQNTNVVTSVNNPVVVPPVVTVVKKPKPAVPIPTVTYSKIGQRFLSNAVFVTPLHVTYDGRCAIDVKCIQAGTVDLGILLQSDNLSQNFILSLGKSIVFAGKTVTFVSVSPKKVSTKTIGETEYRFVITVKK